MAIWRWFSFSRLVGYFNSLEGTWKMSLSQLSRSLLYNRAAPKSHHQKHPAMAVCHSGPKSYPSPFQHNERASSHLKRPSENKQTRKTNIVLKNKSPENPWFENFSFWNGPFVGDMLIVGGYIHSNVALEVLEFSFLRGDMLNCCRRCKHTPSSWTNPFEKYARQIGSFPQEIEVKTKQHYNINLWNHHLVLHTVLHLWAWLVLYITVIHLEIAEAMGFCFFCSKCWIYRIVILLWFLLSAKSNLRVVCKQSLPFFNYTLDIRIPLENDVFSGMFLGSKHLLRRCLDV